MSDHIADANKMVDTPRMNSVAGHARGIVDAAIFAEGMKLERELNAANDRIKRLEDWKQSALAVEREWNANAIATMLGGKLGESQREVIQREVPKLLERVKRLEEAGDALKAAGYFGGFNDAVDKWIKVKEAKP